MTDYADITEYDLFQLIDLDTKIRNEGSLTYTIENWTWEFDNPALTKASRTGDAATLRRALNVTYARREQWWAEHPHPTQIPPLEAHEAEVERRAHGGVDPAGQPCKWLPGCPNPAAGTLNDGTSTLPACDDCADRELELRQAEQMEVWTP